MPSQSHPQFAPTDRKTIGKPGLVRLLADTDPALYTRTAYLTPAALRKSGSASHHGRPSTLRPGSMQAGLGRTGLPGGVGQGIPSPRAGEACPSRHSGKDEGEGYPPPSIVEALPSTNTGAAVFWGDTAALAVVPPFPLREDAAHDAFHLAPLLDLLAADTAVAAVLLRLGRYAVGFFEGDDLLVSKVDTRHVKNRHRAGGQSQRRFERSRERLVNELYDAACSVVQGVLESAGAAPDYVLLGGDKHTLGDFIKRCPVLQSLSGKILARRLPIDRPSRATLDGMPHHIWASQVVWFQRTAE